MNKKTILTIAVFVFMALWSLFFVSRTHAHWSDVELSAFTSPDLTIGEWSLLLEWDPDATYSEGDIVSYNGVLYQARRENPIREPGVDGGWQRDWDAL